MQKRAQLNIKIDKLTRSIENAISGDSFKTEVLKITSTDIKNLKKASWLFDWTKEYKNPTRSIYKLIIYDNQDIIQGLMSIQDRGDHIYMHLIESNKFNKGAKKIYLGVPGNLIAYACKISFESGYSGYVSFESKTRLISHYEEILGAQVLFGNMMAIDTKASTKLVTQYFG